MPFVSKTDLCSLCDSWRKRYLDIMSKNMKRIYVCPVVVVDKATETLHMLASSGLKSDIGIDYGGVDSGGDQKASVKEQSWEDIWD